MTDFPQSMIRDIEAAIAKFGRQSLASRAGVSYTTLASWANRGWRHRQLTIAGKLWEAAKNLLAGR